MTKSLFINIERDLRRLPKGPLRHLKPEALFSIQSLRRGWQKVRATGGGAGVDGVTISQFGADLEANLKTLRRTLLSGEYRPHKVKRLLVPKANQGLRPIALWALRDRVVQRVVTDCIAPYFERIFLPCSYGFRPGLGVADVIAAVIKQREVNNRWVADVDIQDCFDSLDTQLLMRFVRQEVKVDFILTLIEQWMGAQVFNDLKGPGTKAAISQGSVISPLLANVYLHQVDKTLIQKGLNLIRYADDAIICCRRKQEAQVAMDTLTIVLDQVNLKLNPHKSRIVHFDEGFQFLGVFFLRNEYFYLAGGKKGHNS